MGYLITQILIYLILAALIGFLVAWILRGSRLGARIEELENELWRLRAEPPPPSAPTAQPAVSAVIAAPASARGSSSRASAPAAAMPAAPTPAAPTPAAPTPAAPTPASTDATPVAFAAPQGEADDLKRIKGIGPKIEGILHSLGIWHFHQIAAWTPDNAAWVNEQLSFKGRIEREEWIPQAQKLAS